MASQMPMPRSPGVLRAAGFFTTATGQRRGLVLRRFVRNRGAVAGLLIVVLLVLCALAAPLLAPYDPVDQSLRDALKPPSGEHALGTDHLGRDILSRILYGARISLRVGLISTGIAAAIGIPLGLLAGFYAGWTDLLVLRLVDLLLAFPAILLALAITTILGPSLTNAMIAVGISIVPQYVRVTRSATLGARQLDYVLAARTIGCRVPAIVTRHILPNILTPLIVLSSLQIATAILFAAGLSFLGLGAQPPAPEWGAMLTTGRTYLRDAWWIPVFPGIAIGLTVLAMNLVGDGLRDALDPAQRVSVTAER